MEKYEFEKNIKNLFDYKDGEWHEFRIINVIPILIHYLRIPGKYRYLQIPCGRWSCISRRFAEDTIPSLKYDCCNRAILYSSINSAFKYYAKVLKYDPLDNYEIKVISFPKTVIVKLEHLTELISAKKITDFVFNMRYLKGGAFSEKFDLRISNTTFKNKKPRIVPLSPLVFKYPSPLEVQKFFDKLDYRYVDDPGIITLGE